jgi:hypothetical protein
MKIFLYRNKDHTLLTSSLKMWHDQVLPQDFMNITMIQVDSVESIPKVILARMDLFIIAFAQLDLYIYIYGNLRAFEFVKILVT